MSIQPETPDESELIERICSVHTPLLFQNNEHSILTLMQVIGKQLHKTNPGWKYLTKLPSEKHILLGNQRIAVDAFIFEPTMQVVDVLTNAVEETGEAGPAWILKPRRPTSLPYWPEEEKEEKKDEDSTSLLIKINELERRLEEQRKQIDVLSQRKFTLQGKVIGLRNVHNGKFICSDFDKGHEGPVHTNRDNLLSYESFEIVEVE